MNAENYVAQFKQEADALQVSLDIANAEITRLQRQVDALEKILLGANYDLQAVLDYGGPTTKAERGALRNRVRQAEAALRGGKML